MVKIFVVYQSVRIVRTQRVGEYFRKKRYEVLTEEVRPTTVRNQASFIDSAATDDGFIKMAVANMTLVLLLLHCMNRSAKEAQPAGQISCKSSQRFSY